VKLYVFTNTFEVAEETHSISPMTVNFGVGVTAKADADDTSSFAISAGLVLFF